MIAYLDQEHRNQTPSDIPTRFARVEVIVKGEKGDNQLFELVVDLDASKVVKKQHVEGKHSYIDPTYMKAVEKVCLNDARVQAEIKTLRLPKEAQVVVESWAYATDGMNDMRQRVTMVSLALPSALCSLRVP